MIYKANDKYSAALTAGYTVGQTTLYVSAVPDNVPTIVVAGKGTDNETIFEVTGKTTNSLTGVSRLRGANVNLDAQTPLTCLNNEEFINQFAGAASSAETLKNLIYAEDGGSSDDYEISLDPTPEEYVSGMLVAFKANTTNTGAATLNVNSLGPIAIKKNYDEDLADGDIEAGQVAVVVYDGTNFQLVGEVIPDDVLAKSREWDGWLEASETWTYASVDDPTGVIYATGDVTAKYSVGMRIKMTNASHTINGIITVVGAYDSGNNRTPITFLHEVNPSTSLALYLLQNSDISNPYYSTQKAPLGFPLEPTKWTIEMSSTIQGIQNSPTANTWYNLGSLNIVIPIGVWKVEYFAPMETIKSSAARVDGFSTLSTTDNSESDPDLTTFFDFAGLTGNVDIVCLLSKSKTISLASKTTYYLNEKTRLSGINSICIAGYLMKIIVRAICAYL